MEARKKRIGRRLLVEELLDKKIIIPALVTVGLIPKSPVSTFLVDNLGVRGYRLVVAIIASYAAYNIWDTWVIYKSIRTYDNHYNYN